MIGVFDSGVGGLSAYRELRRLLPFADIAYLADKRNAPYGTKTREELIELVKRDVKRLRLLGADVILCACCTASAVCRFLGCEGDGVLPIITPAARIAASLRRVTVIATEYTATCGAFSQEIRRLSPRVQVREIPCQRLVALVEGGCRDGELSPECQKEILRIAEEAEKFNSDGLILGCTHFSHLERSFIGALPRLNIISPAREGAAELVKSLRHEKNENISALRGRTIYTE